MPEPTTDEVKAQVKKLYAQSYSYREIAREVGIGHSTVGRILREAGVDTDGSLTIEATRKRKAIMDAKRLQHAEILMEHLADVESRIWDEYDQYLTGPDGPAKVTLSEPPLKEQADGYKSIQMIVTTVDTLTEKIDTGDGAEGAKNLLRDLQSSLKEVVAMAGPDTDPKNYDSDYSVDTDPEQQEPQQ